MRTGVLVVLSAALLVPAAGCGDGGGTDDGAQVRVVVTLPVLADAAEEVGGDRVRVEALIPAGSDPHTFEPVPSDVTLISEADIVFANGLGLEEATLELIEANLPDGVSLVELAESAAEKGIEILDGDEARVEDASGQDDGDDQEGGNPHLWLDPEAMKEYADIIRENLSVVDAEGAAGYGERYESYRDELDEAERYLMEKVGTVPADYRVLVTTHDAFPYLARAIGFEIGAVVTVSPGQEPSPQAVAEISRTIAETGVPAVFREPQLGAEATVLEQAASDAGVEVCVLYSDSVEDEAGTYIEIIRHNAEEIARCLGGAE